MGVSAYHRIKYRTSGLSGLGLPIGVGLFYHCERRPEPLTDCKCVGTLGTLAFPDRLTDCKCAGTLGKLAFTAHLTHLTHLVHVPE